MKITRRDACKLVAAASVAASSPAFARTSRVHLGAQTNAWTIDPTDLSSFFDVLAQIKRTGYEGFETGYFNLSQHLDDIPGLRARIQAAGLTFFGLHIAVGINKSDPETLLPLSSLYEQLVPAAKELGAQHWIISSVAVKKDAQVDSQIRGKVDGLRRAADFAAKAGLPLLYHNHWWEFSNGGAEMNALLEGTAGAPVRFLFDAGHAFHAGADVPLFLKQHHARIAALHLRDYRDGKQVALGGGTFPLREVAETLRRVSWSGWAINEEDSDGKQKLGLTVIEPAYLASRQAFAS